jgi:hypothetical protein
MLVVVVATWATATGVGATALGAPSAQAMVALATIRQPSATQAIAWIRGADLDSCLMTVPVLSSHALRRAVLLGVHLLSIETFPL